MSSLYTIILQKPYCCAIACFLMIIYRHTGKLYDQEELARNFGVKIGSSFAHAFEKPMNHLRFLTYDEGVNTLGLVKEINTFCEKENIPLVGQIFIPENEDHMKSVILEAIKAGHDIWCEYIRHGFSEKKDRYFYVHDGLIESFDAKKNIYTIVDPEPEKKNRFTIEGSELWMRISGVYGRKTGYIIMTKRNPL